MASSKCTGNASLESVLFSISMLCNCNSIVVTVASRYVRTNSIDFISPLLLYSPKGDSFELRDRRAICQFWDDAIDGCIDGLLGIEDWSEFGRRVIGAQNPLFYLIPRDVDRIDLLVGDGRRGFLFFIF